MHEELGLQVGPITPLLPDLRYRAVDDQPEWHAAPPADEVPDQPGDPVVHHGALLGDQDTAGPGPGEHAGGCVGSQDPGIGRGSQHECVRRGDRRGG
ncbi:hypothetical protein [Arachnia propionica]|uniref:hypothetical protein n=1 Tax=Arachnia propionica TaxID=1750 RepID=UPI0021AB3977|nr:hypothetical protein [Arachnia propionica]